MDNNEILAKLEKIKRLADKGIDGEQSAAKAMLDKLCKKYGIKPEDLGEGAFIEVEIEAKNKRELELLYSLFLEYVGTDSDRVIETKTYERRNGKRLLGFLYTIKIAPAYGIILQEAVDYYLPIFREEWKYMLDNFVNAFRMKHDINIKKVKQMSAKNLEYMRNLERMGGGMKNKAKYKNQKKLGRGDLLNEG